MSNVTLHPTDAPWLFDNSNVIAACQTLSQKKFLTAGNLR